MSKLLDLHVVSIPDHKAQMAVAQLIVGTNSQISMHTAMDMAKSPPILLYRNIERKDAKQFIENLKVLNVGFKVSEAEPAASELEEEKREQEALTESAINEILGSASAVSGGNADDTDNNGNAESAESPAEDLISQFAAIKDHNIEAKKTAAPNDAAAPTENVQKSIQTAIDHHHDHSDNSHHGVGNVHSNPRSGIRVGGIGLDDIAKAEETAKRRNTQVAVGAALLFLIIGLILYLMPDQKNIAVNRAPIVTKSGDNQTSDRGRAGNRGQVPAAAQPQETARDARDKQRSKVSSAQRQRANAMIDSARTTEAADHNKIISFYRMAISFNRYNLQAWQGLLQAYRDASKMPEARETEEQIREIFGNEAMTVNALVQQFGDIADAYMNDDGMYRLEYRTSKRTRDEILREVFTMTRSVRSACRCLDISIYASTGPGRGLIVHSTHETSIHTLSTFSMQAGIVWLD